jgi:hypothetical protein
LKSSDRYEVETTVETARRRRGGLVAVASSPAAGWHDGHRGHRDALRQFAPAVPLTLNSNTYVRVEYSIAPRHADG